MPFGLLLAKRQTIRHYINENDKSTVVSIFPMDIDEKKSTIQPGRFLIPAGHPTSPSLLVVGGASWWREMNPDEPLIEIPQYSSIVAEAVVTDYCSGMLGYAHGEKDCGLFWVNGAITAKDLEGKLKPVLEAAIRRQHAWYVELIKQADNLWARTNGNPLAIPDLMRLACKELQLDRAWLKDFENINKVNCKACGNLVNPAYPVCPVCRAVSNPELAKELGIKFAS